MTNNPQLREEQYSNADKFNARIYLNAKFGTNPYPWPAWLFDQFEKPDNCKVLELGCGTGLLWQVNTKRIPITWEIILSDYSEGMLAHTQNNLANISRKIDYRVINAENIGFPDQSFDMVIANNMLYHIPHREKAFGEIKRILKENGFFYAATASSKNMYELKMLMKKFKNDHAIEAAFETIVSNFSLENGAAQLRNYFTKIELRRYDDSLEITEAEPIVNYFLSLNGMSANEISLAEDQVAEFRRYISEELARDGKISVSKDSGIFICKK